jgi:hypothetical protein
MTKDKIVDGSALVLATAVLVLKLLDLLLCSNAQDKKKYNDLLLGKTWSQLDGLNASKWPQIAADRFYALILLTIGEGFVGPQAVVASFLFSTAIMLASLPFGLSWLAIIGGVVIAAIGYIAALLLWFPIMMLAPSKWTARDSFLGVTLSILSIGCIYIGVFCVRRFATGPTTGWWFATVSGATATVNMIFDLLSIYVTRALVKYIRDSKGWVPALTLWALDLAACTFIAAATFWTVNTIETAFGVPQRSFPFLIRGTTASLPYALTGLVPTGLHVLFFLLTAGMFCWELVRTWTMNILYRAWEREGSPFSQIAGGALLVGGLIVGALKAFL